MGLNPRGRGRGGKGPFSGKGRRGGGMGGQGPMFRGPPGMYGPPPMGFPPGPQFGGPFYGGPCGSNFGPRRPPGFGKFQRKNFKGKPNQKNNNSQTAEIDLTKPWVTDEIKSEDAKKQEYLEIWRKSKDDGDWSKYKEQKQIVQTMYDKAQADYTASRPEEAYLWLAKQPSVKRYYCDTCDKTFADEDTLLLHEVEHETCGRDGCTFTAHPKVIAKHVKMQHDSGLYKRIGQLYTDEDIKKWIEERKRKYPTKKTVEERKKLEEEKIKRGERVKEKDSKFNTSFLKRNDRSGKIKSFEKKSMKNIKAQRRKRKQKSFEKGLTVSDALKEENSFRGSVPPFRGIRDIPDSGLPEEKEDINFSDEEWEAPQDMEKGAVVENKNLRNSLGLLATCYDSDAYLSEAITEEQKEIEVETCNGPPKEDAPEEVKTIRIREEELPLFVPEAVKKRMNPSRRRRRGGKMNCDYDKECETVSVEGQAKRFREETLLEKLLEKEIRHERNVILQCVRYVVQNNFLLDFT